MKTTEKLNLDLPISILKHWNGKFEKLPANKIYNLIIDYPVSQDFVFPINTGKSGISLISLINEIGKAYRKIYKNPSKYGVWGHDIGDLILVEIKVNHKKKLINIIVDS